MEKKVYVAPAIEERIRTPEHISYLRKVAEKYKSLKYLNPDIAKALLETIKATNEYKEARFGITKEELAKKKFLSCLLGLDRLRYKEYLSREDENCIHSNLEELINILENNKEFILTKKGYIDLKRIIRFGKFTDGLRPKFWDICMDRDGFIKEEDKESVFSSHLEELKLPKLEKIIQASNNKEFIHKMFQSIVLSGIIDKISPETNTKFLNTLFTNPEDKTRILKGFLSEKCKNLKECLKKLDPHMKEALKLELKNDETLINLSKEIKYERDRNFIDLLESFGVTVTLPVLLSFGDKLKYSKDEDADRLIKLVPEAKIKNALEEMFEKGDEKYVIGLTYLFNHKGCSLWGYVDEKYRTPKYLNPHMKIISEGFRLSNEDRIGLLKDLKKSKEIGEKYNACLVIDEMLGNADDERIDLIIDTVELDENSDSRLLYVKMKKNGKVDEETIFNIIKNIGNMKSFEGEFNLKLDIKQRVYGTENKKLIVEFIKNFGEFYKICSDEEIDVFITKFIHAMSDKDVKTFKDVILSMYHRGKIKSSLLFKIECFMGYIDVSNRTSLPKDVYIRAIKEGKIGLDSEFPPKVDAESSYINSEDLNRLLGMLKTYDDKRSEENVKKLVQETINDGEKGEVIFNFTKQRQKYIFCIDYEKPCLKFITEDLSYHANIFKKYVEDGECFGGGRVKMDEKEKTITLFDKSGDYGRVDGDYKKAMLKTLEEKFPGYTIEFKYGEADS